MGRDAFSAMLAAIEAARESVCLEIYIYAGDPLGEQFREALVRARQRGASVRVLIDGFGSIGLPNAFWQPLLAASGEVRVFNPLLLNHLGIRNHRKLLVCDQRIAFIGGFNIAKEYDGDGVTSGWCDLGLRLEGSLVPQLAASFDEMFARADFREKLFVRFRKTSSKKTIRAANEHLLLSGPGRGRSPIKRALTRDLAHAGNVQIIMAYFVPTWRIRRQLARTAFRGGNVQLLLAGKTDVLVSQLAAQSLYRRLLNARVKIFEYEPQILHAKLIIIDNVVYVGSANLDPRSLHLNYELLVRFESQEMAAQARDLFAACLRHSRRITPESWAESRTFWGRLKRRWAYFLVVRIDPYLARRQWRGLPD
jgi:cardiolipin synthase